MDLNNKEDAPALVAKLEPAHISSPPMESRRSKPIRVHRMFAPDVRAEIRALRIVLDQEGGPGDG